MIPVTWVLILLTFNGGDNRPVKIEGFTRTGCELGATKFKALSARHVAICVDKSEPR